MRFNIEIDCDNDAFAKDWQPEVARILRVAANRLEHLSETGWCMSSRPVMDHNGNRVGFISVGE